MNDFKSTTVKFPQETREKLAWLKENVNFKLSTEVRAMIDKRYKTEFKKQVLDTKKDNLKSKKPEIMNLLKKIPSTKKNENLIQLLIEVITDL